MNNKVTGLHHITALSSDAQDNIDFYAGILGLRLVKKTVNFDAPDVYHLYYGDNEGSPGSLLTFFPYPGLPRGRKGAGQLTVTAFSIPPASMNYWKRRLEKFGIGASNPKTRYNEEFIYFEDGEGLGLELVASGDDPREGFGGGHIPAEHAIKGFYGITLNEHQSERTGLFLADLLDHGQVADENGRKRYSTGRTGGIVDIIGTGEGVHGRQGSGTVHHVAFAVPDGEKQAEVRELLLSEGVHVTPVIDRLYFKSIYFREPGGVLFEVATLPPGMTIDEDISTLGGSLKLPSWHEDSREEIENNLKPLNFMADRFTDQPGH